MSMPPLEILIRHDRETTASLLNLSQDLSDEELDREFDIGHRTLRRTFHHIDIVIAWWTGFLLDDPVTEEPDPGSIAEMRERHESVYDRFEQAVRAISAEGREWEIFLDARPYPQTRIMTILHIILHSHLHRGEVLHILERLGVADLPEGDPQEWGHANGLIPTSIPVP